MLVARGPKRLIRDKKQKYKEEEKIKLLYYSMCVCMYVKLYIM